MIYIEYPKCSTCSKLKKDLSLAGITFESRHIVENNLNATELKELHEKSGVDIKKFFNTSGMKYRELSLKDKLPTMTVEEKYDLLASDGMLVKRPILLSDTHVFIGKEVLKVLDN